MQSQLELGTYHELVESQKQIRLMRIHATSGSQQESSAILACSLETVALEDANPFYALSYVWGPPSPTLPILLNDRTVLIRENLWHFLHALRSRFCPRASATIRVWADYVCIQQSNLRELSYQVSIMGELYRAADAVYGWLGDWQGSEDDEMDRVELIRRMRRQNRSWSFISRQCPTALPQIASSSYWTRLWIKQEVILAKDLWLFRGNKVANWSDIRFTGTLGRSRVPSQASEHVTGCSANPEPDSNSMQSLLNWRALHLSDLELPELVARFSSAGCQDSRDKLYALLSLTDLSTRQRVAVDYQKPLLQVLLDSFAHWTGEKVTGENFEGLPTPAPTYRFQSFCTQLLSLLSPTDLRELYCSPDARRNITAEGVFNLSELSLITALLPIARFNEHSIWPISEAVQGRLGDQGVVVRITTQKSLSRPSESQRERFIYVDDIPQPGDLLGHLGSRVFILRALTDLGTIWRGSPFQNSVIIATGSEVGEQSLAARDFRRLSARRMVHPCRWKRQQLPDASYRLLGHCSRSVPGLRYCDVKAEELSVLCNSPAIVALLLEARPLANEDDRHRVANGNEGHEQSRFWSPYEFVLTHHVLPPGRHQVTPVDAIQQDSGFSESSHLRASDDHHDR